MIKPFSLILLIAGVILLAYGITTADSIGSSISRFFTGKPTDKAMWLLIGGTVAAVLGLTGLIRDSKNS
jgi:uncharacterized membrane protein